MSAAAAGSAVSDETFLRMCADAPVPARIALYEANLNAMDARGRTPLMIACEGGTADHAELANGILTMYTLPAYEAPAIIKYVTDARAVAERTAAGMEDQRFIGPLIARMGEILTRATDHLAGLERIFRNRLRILTTLQKKVTDCNILINGSAALRTMCEKYGLPPPPHGEPISDIDSFSLLTPTESYTVAHIAANVCRTLETICANMGEAYLGIPPGDAALPEQLRELLATTTTNCVEVNRRAGFDRDPGLMTFCGELLAAIGPLDEAIPLQRNVTRWSRATRCPFNILLNFEYEHRLRLVMRGCRPTGTIAIPGGEHVLVFPEIVDITMYWDPTSVGFRCQNALFRKFLPVMTTYSAPRYAGDGMILCQQMILLYSLALRDPNTVPRRQLVIALFRQFKEREGSAYNAALDVMLNVLAEYDAYYETKVVEWFRSFLTFVDDAVVGGAGGKRKTRQRKQRKQRKQRTRRQ